jgi:hypothetical protein
MREAFSKRLPLGEGCRRRRLGEVEYKASIFTSIPPQKPVGIFHFIKTIKTTAFSGASKSCSC